MKIAHVAVWTDNPERLRDFYVTYLNGVSNEKYVNPKKGFESFFVSFEGEASIEIMKRTDVTERVSGEYLGWCHLAFALESKEAVCELTERLRADGYTIAGEPRTTGDGCFESVVLDVDSNRVELVAE